MEHFLFILRGTVAILIIFGLAVFVHEFGHMMFALLRGVGVESFAIGMGPKITSWKWRGIEFSLRWLPVGGFVKLLANKPPVKEGEEGAAPEGAASEPAGEPAAEPAADEKSLADSSYDDLFALQDKGFVTKVLVFGGGVFMNFVTAIVSLALLYWIGITINLFPLKIDKVEPDSEIARAGFKPGDEVVKLNNKPVKYDMDLDDVYAKIKADAAAEKKDAPPLLTLAVLRGGKDVLITTQPLSFNDADILMIGLFKSLWQPALIGDLVPSMPAEKAGFHRGDMVVAVDGKAVDSYEQLAGIVNNNLDKELTAAIKRGGKQIEIKVKPQAGIEALGQDPKKGYIGFTAGSPIRITKREPLLTALAAAPSRAVTQIIKLAQINAKFFRTASFTDVRKNVTGPIGIAALTAKLAQNGMEDLARWFITLNLLLMVFNLLPIPVLDGGFILLAVIEGIIRRPVPAKVLAPIYTVCMVGLIILMALITMQDVVNWILPKFH